MSSDPKTRSLRRPSIAIEVEEPTPAAMDSRGPRASPSLDPTLRPPGLTSMSRTVFAVAAALRSGLASHMLGPSRRTLWLSAPARSTECGARSKQLLSLVTPFAELPCGWLDLVNAKCVIVPWDALTATHRARETTNLEFSREDYLAFAGWLTELLAPMKIRVCWATRR